MKGNKKKIISVSLVFLAIIISALYSRFSSNTMGYENVDFSEGYDDDTDGGYGGGDGIDYFEIGSVDEFDIEEETNSFRNYNAFDDEEDYDYMRSQMEEIDNGADVDADEDEYIEDDNDDEDVAEDSDTDSGYSSDDLFNVLTGKNFGVATKNFNDNYKTWVKEEPYKTISKLKSYDYIDLDTGSKSFAIRSGDYYYYLKYEEKDGKIDSIKYIE